MKLLLLLLKFGTIHLKCVCRTVVAYSMCWVSKGDCIMFTYHGLPYFYLSYCFCGTQYFEQLVQYAARCVVMIWSWAQVLFMCFDLVNKMWMDHNLDSKHESNFVSVFLQKPKKTSLNKNHLRATDGSKYRNIKCFW